MENGTLKEIILEGIKISYRRDTTETDTLVLLMELEKAVNADGTRRLHIFYDRVK